MWKVYESRTKVMFFIQNRYPDDFFYIFLSLFSLSPEITTPRHSFTTFTTAYTASIYPTSALRLVTRRNNRERHNTQNDTPIILCQPLSHINIATAPPAKDGRRRIPARQSSCPTTSKAAHHPPIRRPTFRAANILNRRMAFADAYGIRAPKFLPSTTPWHLRAVT